MSCGNKLFKRTVRPAPSLVKHSISMCPTSHFEIWLILLGSFEGEKSNSVSLISLLYISCPSLTLCIVFEHDVLFHVATRSFAGAVVPSCLSPSSPYAGAVMPLRLVTFLSLRWAAVDLWLVTFLSLRWGSSAFRIVTFLSQCWGSSAFRRVIFLSQCWGSSALRLVTLLSLRWGSSASQAWHLPLPTLGQ